CASDVPYARVMPCLSTTLTPAFAIAVDEPRTVTLPLIAPPAFSAKSSVRDLPALTDTGVSPEGRSRPCLVPASALPSPATATDTTTASTTVGTTSERTQRRIVPPETLVEAHTDAGPWPQPRPGVGSVGSDQTWNPLNEPSQFLFL